MPTSVLFSAATLPGEAVDRLLHILFAEDDPFETGDAS